MSDDWQLGRFHNLKMHVWASENSTEVYKNVYTFKSILCDDVFDYLFVYSNGY